MAENYTNETWNAVAVHSADRRNFTRVNEGLELAVVGRDTRTGATSMFERIRQTAAPAAQAAPHSHRADCQTLVLSGTVEIAFGGDRHTLKAGDYLRVPAGVEHTQTLVSDDAVMFVTTAGQPGIEFAPGAWAGKKR
jgi:quercetin dioxygenase-like cupin family protein